MAFLRVHGDIERILQSVITPFLIELDEIQRTPPIIW
jgi:hypothetical protein